MTLRPPIADLNPKLRHHLNRHQVNIARRSTTRVLHVDEIATKILLRNPQPSGCGRNSRCIKLNYDDRTSGEKRTLFPPQKFPISNIGTDNNHGKRLTRQTLSPIQTDAATALEVDQTIVPTQTNPKEHQIHSPSNILLHSRYLSLPS
jgi:hypothetical protein